MNEEKRRQSMIEYIVPLDGTVLDLKHKRKLIHCAECKFWKKKKFEGYSEMICTSEDWGGAIVTFSEDFCSYAQKKGEKE